MIRVHLRVVDRLLNLGIPVQRHRCSAPICAHELLTKPPTLDAAARPWAVSAALAVIAMLLALYLTSQIQANFADLQPDTQAMSHGSEEATVIER
jgi:hypothetical protein